MGVGFSSGPQGGETPRWEWVYKVERLTVKDQRKEAGEGETTMMQVGQSVQVLEEGREA